MAEEVVVERSAEAALDAESDVELSEKSGGCRQSVTLVVENGSCGPTVLPAGWAAALPMHDQSYAFFSRVGFAY